MGGYGQVPYAGSSPEDVALRANLQGAGALSAVPYEEPPPPTALSGEGTLAATAFPSHSGGSVATVLTSPEGLGTKVLAGSTSQVLVTARGAGSRVPPYAIHPNTRPDSNYVTGWAAALARFPRDEAQEPRSGEGRQSVLLGKVPAGTSTTDEDESIFAVDHR